MFVCFFSAKHNTGEKSDCSWARGWQHQISSYSFGRSKLKKRFYRGARAIRNRYPTGTLVWPGLFQYSSKNDVIVTSIESWCVLYSNLMYSVTCTYIEDVRVHAGQKCALVILQVDFFPFPSYFKMGTRNPDRPWIWILTLGDQIRMLYRLSYPFLAPYSRWLDIRHPRRGRQLLPWLRRRNERRSRLGRGRVEAQNRVKASAPPTSHCGASIQRHRAGQTAWRQDENNEWNAASGSLGTRPRACPRTGDQLKWGPKW